MKLRKSGFLLLANAAPKQERLMPEGDGFEAVESLAEIAKTHACVGVPVRYILDEHSPRLEIPFHAEQRAVDDPNGETIITHWETQAYSATKHDFSDGYATLTIQPTPPTPTTHAVPTAHTHTIDTPATDTPTPDAPATDTATSGSPSSGLIEIEIPEWKDRSGATAKIAVGGEPGSATCPQMAASVMFVHDNIAGVRFPILEGVPSGHTCEPLGFYSAKEKWHDDGRVTATWLPFSVEGARAGLNVTVHSRFIRTGPHRGLHCYAVEAMTSKPLTTNPTTTTPSGATPTAGGSKSKSTPSGSKSESTLLDDPTQSGDSTRAVYIEVAMLKNQPEQIALPVRIIVNKLEQHTADELAAREELKKQKNTQKPAGKSYLRALTDTIRPYAPQPLTKLLDQVEASTSGAASTPWERFTKHLYRRAQLVSTLHRNRFEGEFPDEDEINAYEEELEGQQTARRAKRQITDEEREDRMWATIQDILAEEADNRPDDAEFSSVVTRPAPKRGSELTDEEKRKISEAVQRLVEERYVDGGAAFYARSLRLPPLKQGKQFHIPQAHACAACDSKAPRRITFGPRLTMMREQVGAIDAALRTLEPMLTVRSIAYLDYDVMLKNEAPTHPTEAYFVTRGASRWRWSEALTMDQASHIAPGMYVGPIMNAWGLQPSLGSLVRAILALYRQPDEPHLIEFVVGHERELSFSEILYLGRRSDYSKITEKAHTSPKAKKLAAINAAFRYLRENNQADKPFVEQRQAALKVQASLSRAFEMDDEKAEQKAKKNNGATADSNAGSFDGESKDEANPQTEPKTTESMTEEEGKPTEASLQEEEEEEFFELADEQ